MDSAPLLSDERRKALAGVRRVVVKVGTNLVIGQGDAKNRTWLLHFVKDMITLRQRGIEVVIVSSGAIGAGMHLLGITRRPHILPLKQACAAVGQNQIMQLYERLFRRHGVRVGQVLLTTEDLWNRNRYLNLRYTINALLDLGVVPIINENDSITVREIKVGDNDTLSAHVTNFVEAELLVILTDIDGLYSADPKKDSSAVLIREVRQISPAIRKCCGGKGSETSVGGMRTKIAAAAIVTRSGEKMIIANGYKDTVADLLAGKNAGTLFYPAHQGLSSKKRWIAFSQKTNGCVTVDDGGATALIVKKKSLLPVGVQGVEGTFKQGDLVTIRNLRNEVIGRGIANYSSAQVDAIKGRRTNELAAILGQVDYEEVIHRDNLAVAESS